MAVDQCADLFHLVPIVSECENERVEGAGPSRGRGRGRGRGGRGGGGGTNMEDIVCHKCNEQGHIARSCPENSMDNIKCYK